MRKKLLYSILALLLVCGVAFATNVPEVIEPKEGGPAVWLESVYNNSSSNLVAGDIVIWDVDASTGDNDQWVNTTTTAGTYLVAGIVYPNPISAGAIGTIAVHGPVTVNLETGTGNSVVADSAICTSATAVKATVCASGNNANRVGHAVSSQSSNTATVWLNIVN